MNILIT